MVGIVREEILSGAEADKLLELAAAAFYQHNGLLSHQFHSFDRLCETLPSLFTCQAQKELSLADDREGHATITFANVVLLKPEEPNKGNPRPLLPAEARLRNISYSGVLQAHVEFKLYESQKVEESIETTLVKEQTLEDVRIGEIPIMVKSKLCHLYGTNLPELKDCPFDSGGYFITKGVEKVLVPQEDPLLQIVRVSSSKKNTWTASFANPTDRFPNQVEVNYTPDGCFTVDIPGVKPIPVVIMLRALGISTDKQLLELMTHDLEEAEVTELIRPSLADAEAKMLEFMRSSDSSIEASRKMECALEFIGSNMKKNEIVPGAEVIEQRLLPRMGAGNARKAIFLGYMVLCLCHSYLGWRSTEDVDSFKNKRVMLAGDLLNLKLSQLKFRYLKDIWKRLQKCLEAGKDSFTDSMLFDKSLVTNGIERAFSTGIWGLNAKSSGVVATLRRDNPMATLSHLRLVSKGMTYAGNAGAAKLPNASHYGRICPAETPDNEKCGLTKSLAAFAKISSQGSEDDVLDRLSDCQMQSLDDIVFSELHKWGKVFVNGKWMGITDNPEILLSTMRTLRREGLISPETEIVRVAAQNEVRLQTDGGRLLRPLLVLENRHPRLLTRENKRCLERLSPDRRFPFMIDSGLVELLGPHEEENAVIAGCLAEIQSTANLEFTHMELHKAAVLGIGALGIPFMNHNQSSRVTHQAQKHGRQAIGFYTCNINGRMDTSAHQLFYPQKPLLLTRSTQFFGSRVELASGNNCVVAVSPCGGYNQEDSLILNQSSLDRGLFRSTHYRVYKDSLPAKADQRFGKPDEDAAKKRSNHNAHKLDPDGLPPVETFLTADDPVIGKMATKTTKFMDLSHKVKPMTNPAVVDAVVYSSGSDGDRNIKVRLREMRTPEIGDKFSSMHGQKGVVGMNFRQEDLFFNQQGIVPDLIINPHAFPTRQTLAQLLESALGKAFACDPSPGDHATPFVHPGVEDIAEKLHRCGFQRWGKERVYDGRTGKYMDALTTMGITFYQRLTHMASDKVKWRSLGGPLHPLSMQPVKDRNRQGGVQFGEMERDCLIAHGAAAAVQERLFLLSDKTQALVCTSCKNLIPSTRSSPYCCYCNSKHKIARLDIPNALRLLHMELSTMCIDMRLKVEM